MFLKGRINMPKVEKLFSTVNIGTMELNNSICMGKIATQSYQDGNMSRATIDSSV